jgi:hypothetical protein
MRLGARALFLQVAVLVAWLTIPALSGDGFPLSIAELLPSPRSASDQLQVQRSARP